jgi:hypothetical protein
MVEFGIIPVQELLIYRVTVTLFTHQEQQSPLIMQEPLANLMEQLMGATTPTSVLSSITQEQSTLRKEP